MHNREINFCLTPEKSLRLNKKSLLFNQPPKKIQRKPSNKQLKQPKPKPNDIDNHYQQSPYPSSHVQNSSLKNTQNKLDLNSLSRTICYLSPKHTNITCILPPNSSKQKTNQNYKSMDDLKFKQILSHSHHRNNTVSKSKSKNQQPPQSRYTNTNKSQIFDHNTNHVNSPLNTSFFNKMDTYQPSPQQLSFKSIHDQNQQLINQNFRLNQRLIQLKQQNQYLYKQIQILHTQIKTQNSTNIQLQSKNSQLKSKLIDDQTQMQQFKKNYKIQQSIRNNYQILQRMYKKIINQHDILINKNKFLSSQNQKLIIQVNDLRKIIDQLPTHKKPRKKSKDKQFHFGFDKENYGTTISFDPPSSSTNNKLYRFSKNNREDQSFFDLSPQ